MDNNTFFRIAAEQHVGYIKAAVQRRAERIRNNAPTLRDQVQHLADCSGTYLVGSSNLGCYKFGYAVSLRNGIGSHGFYPFKLDVIMWCGTDEGKRLAEQLRDLFRTKSCKVPDTSGEWFQLNEEDLETLRTKFRFVTDLVGGTSGQG
jgi:hypothetical protein